MSGRKGMQMTHNRKAGRRLLKNPQGQPYDLDPGWLRARDERIAAHTRRVQQEVVRLSAKGSHL